MMDLVDHGAEARAPDGAPRRRLAAVLGALAAVSALAGCAGPSRLELQREIDAVRSELLKARADAAALSERLDALELRGQRPAAPATAAASAPPSPPRPSDGDRPALDVVKLGPAGAAAPAESDDATPTVLRSSGKDVVKEAPKGAKKPPGSTPVDPAKQLDKATNATPRPSPAAAPAPGAKK
jgi:hypothetical protein